MSDFLEDFFDLNNDGEVDPLEVGIGLDIIDDIEKKCSNQPNDDFDSFDDEDDDDSDDCDSDSDFHSTYSAPVYKPTRIANTPPPQTNTDSYGYDDERYTEDNNNTVAKTNQQEPEPEVWTEAYYISRKQTETQGLFSTLLILLAVAAAPFFLFIIGFSYIGRGNGVESFFCGICILVASVLTIWIIYNLGVAISEYANKVHELTNKLILRGEDSEIKHFKKMRIVKRVVAILIMLGIIAAIAVPLTAEYVQKETAYKNAENLVWDKQYYDAIQKLEALDDQNYKDTQALIAYCRSHIEYEQSDYSEAYYKMRGVTFNHQSTKNLEEIKQYRDKVKEMYDSYLDSYSYKQNTAKQYTTASPAPTTKYKSTIKRSQNSYTTSDDPYDAKSYGNADDFYYDHYDDFFDYEDAEDYFNDNSE